MNEDKVSIFNTELISIYPLEAGTVSSLIYPYNPPPVTKIGVALRSYIKQYKEHRDLWKGNLHSITYMGDHAFTSKDIVKLYEEELANG